MKQKSKNTAQFNFSNRTRNDRIADDIVHKGTNGAWISQPCDLHRGRAIAQHIEATAIAPALQIDQQVNADLTDPRCDGMVGPG